jgi:hypothetical protein
LSRYDFDPLGQSEVYVSATERRMQNGDLVRSARAAKGTTARASHIHFSAWLRAEAQAFLQSVRVGHPFTGFKHYHLHR